MHVNGRSLVCRTGACTCAVGGCGCGAAGNACGLAETVLAAAEAPGVVPCDFGLLSTATRPISRKPAQIHIHTLKRVRPLRTASSWFSCPSRVRILEESDDCFKPRCATEAAIAGCCTDSSPPGKASTSIIRLSEMTGAAFGN